jgi:hypothetical protein
VEALVDYAWPREDHDYYVKVKLYRDELDNKQIEFETFFGRIPLSSYGKEVTMNFHINNFT